MAEAQVLVQNIGGVTVVDFTDSSILDGIAVETIGQRLYELVDERARRKVLLDFTQVKFLSSSLLGVLIKLQQKAKAIKGRIAICGLRPELRRVFEISRTEKLFSFYDSEEAALNSFGVFTRP